MSKTENEGIPFFELIIVCLVIAVYAAWYVFTPPGIVDRPMYENEFRAVSQREQRCFFQPDSREEDEICDTMQNYASDYSLKWEKARTECYRENSDRDDAIDCVGAAGRDLLVELYYLAEERYEREQARESKRRELQRQIEFYKDRLVELKRDPKKTKEIEKTQAALEAAKAEVSNLWRL